MPAITASKLKPWKLNAQILNNCNLWLKVYFVRCGHNLSSRHSKMKCDEVTDQVLRPTCLFIVLQRYPLLSCHVRVISCCNNLYCQNIMSNIITWLNTESNMRSTRETRVNNGPTVYIEDNRLNKVFSIKNVVSELIAKLESHSPKGHLGLHVASC